MRERSCTRFRFSIGRIPLPPDIETVGHTKTGKPDDAAQDRDPQYFAAFRRKHPYLLLEVLEYDESMDGHCGDHHINACESRSTPSTPPMPDHPIGRPE